MRISLDYSLTSRKPSQEQSGIDSGYMATCRRPTGKSRVSETPTRDWRGLWNDWGKLGLYFINWNGEL